MPAVEIASFPASDALLANPLLAKGAYDLVSKAEGFISAYHGLQVEDQKTAYFAITWESVEHHKKLQASPEYAAIVAELKPALAGPFTMHHVEFNADHTNAFSAPVTQLIVSKLKDSSQSRDELEALTTAIFKGLGAAAGAHPPGVWGEAKEEANTFYSAIGWDSVEAHKAAVSGDAAGQGAAKAAQSVEFSIAHVNFTKAA